MRGPAMLPRARRDAKERAMTTDLRYPIGKAETPRDLDPEQRRELISRIERTPDRLREAVAGLNPEQLDTPYRDGGWTVRQLVHHVPDSHLNAYTRFKLALTEENPTIKTYEEDRWANLPDVQAVPIETSLQLLEALHARWAGLLNAMGPSEF